MKRTRSFRAAPFAGLLLLLTAGRAEPQSLAGYGDYLDWVGWARVAPTQRAGLASSWDRSGGPIDANHYEWPPGRTYGTQPTVAATLTGPGILHRFWMPHACANQQFALRVYFDGESIPRIDTRSDLILGGLLPPFDGPLRTTFAGGHVSYVPMPFRESVRIETENHNLQWHWYHWSYRLFPPGTDLESFSPTLDAPAAAARAAVESMFVNAGAHPAGSSETAIVVATGPAGVPPGTTWTLADLPGPGVVRRLSISPVSPDDAALDSTRLRVFADGDDDPSFDVSLAQFFGAGHGRAPYRSLPIGADSSLGLYCYWPMPFRESFTVELVTGGPAAFSFVSAAVEFEPGPVAEDLGEFRAEARTAVVQTGGTSTDFVVTNGAGHFVGSFLFMQDDHNTHTFLENDVYFVADGTVHLRGTGIEDEYNGGFYYNWVPNPQIEPEGPSPPFAIRPLCGILKVERTASPPWGRADQYRWMIADRVPFASSFQASLETQDCAPGCEIRTTAFWYELPDADTDAPPSPDARSRGLELSPIVPNPAGDHALIRFHLARADEIRLEVIDVAGRRLETIAEGRRSAGPHEVTWRPPPGSSGVLFVRLQAGETSLVRKFARIR